MLKLATLLLGTLLASPSLAVFGPIGTSRPNPPGGSIANNQPPSSFFQGRAPPYPTDDWWVGYAAAAGDAMVAGPFPYQSRLLADSIHFGVSTTRQFDGTSIKQPTQVDWTASFVEHSGAASDHKALNWDTQTVAVQYFTGSSSVVSYMVPGSPYMTFNYVSATPVFKSVNGLIKTFAGVNVVDGGASVSSTGTKFTVTNTAGSYIIYSLSGPITLSATAVSGAGTIRASGKYSGVIRVAKLASPAHQATLDTYVANYATAVSTDYTFSGDTAVLQFTWTVTGNAGNLLQLSWPHHRRVLVNANFLPTTSLSHLTTKGYMYPVLGNVWSMQYALPTISWNAPRAPHSSCKSSLVKGLEYEVKQLAAETPNLPGDFYYWGGRFAAISRLALIAEQVGRNDLIPVILTNLKASFAYWTAPSGITQVAYETAWGGVINKAGYNNVWVDFGNGYYNDHHFHNGYLLAGASVIAKYDSGWLGASNGAGFTNGDLLSWFARDIANPSKADPHFTPTRHRDWFAGHSWASGIAGGAGPRDQESIGEAVNGYYGVLLYAEVTGKTDLKNYARLLIATEQQAGIIYWHLYPGANGNARDEPYPEQGVRDLVTMGNIMDWQSGAWLFWGAQRTQIAAIQILPLTPINEYMYDATWARNMYNYIGAELSDNTVGDDFKSVCIAAYAAADPQAAATRSSALGTWGSGNTFSNQLYFISTRANPSGAAICGSSSANPEGTFLIQEVSTGQFVTSSAARLELFADSGVGSATKYSFGFVPGGGSMRAVVTGQYVTADAAGMYTLAAARTVVSGWEGFVIRQKSGDANGIYTIQASSNKGYVVRIASGALVNSGKTENAGSGFRLVSA